MSFRVTLSENASQGTLAWKSADGHGGYAPGDLAGTGLFELASEQIAEIRSLIEAAPICLPYEDVPPMNDGAQWIFEIASDQNYCFHDVQSPHRSPFYDLGRRLIDLSGVEIRENDIY